MGQPQRGQFAAQGAGQHVAPVPQLGGDRAQVARPGRGSDQFQGRLLERAGYEEAVHHLDGAQPVQYRAAGGERAHPQAGRGGLGQRPDVHHDPVVVLGGQGRGQRPGVLVGQGAGIVVLDDEGPGGPRDPQHLGPPGRCEDGSGRVLEQRLAYEHPRAGRVEGGGEQLRPDAFGIHRDGHGPAAGGTGDGQQPGVGRGLDQDRRAGRGQRAQGGRQRALPAGGDQYRDGAADLPGEPVAQFGQPLHGRPPPGPGAPAGPGQGGGHGPLGLERGVQVAAVELDHAGRRGREGGQHPGGVDGARDHVPGALRAEGDLLPGGVPWCGCRGAGPGPERTGAGPGDHEALGGELGEGPGDGDGADPVALDEGPARRQLSTDRVAVQLGPQGSRQLRHTATLLHDSTE